MAQAEKRRKEGTLATAHLFPRTTGRVAAATQGGFGKLAVFAVLAVAWGWWLVDARLTVRATTSEARAQRLPENRILTAPASGVLEDFRIELGRRVDAGTAVCRIRAVEEQLAEGRSDAARAGAEKEAGMVDRMLGLERVAAGAAGAAFEEKAVAAERRCEESRAAVEAAERMREMTAGAADRGVVPRMKVEEAEASLRNLRARAETDCAEAEARRKDSKTEAADRESRIAELERKATELRARARLASFDAKTATARKEVRTLLAGETGVIGDVSPLRPGDFVKEGALLGKLVPDASTVFVGRFDPKECGRIKAGQKVLLRCTAFPWLQFGCVEGRVTRVADEIADGALRVEIEPTRIPEGIKITNGLAADAEIEIETVSPWLLILRMIGAERGKA